MTDMIVNFVLAHREYLYGFAIGYALGHVPQMVSFAFNTAMKVPFIRAAVLSNPEQLKKMIDEIEQTLDKEIDEEVAASKPAPPK